MKKLVSLLLALILCISCLGAIPASADDPDAQPAGVDVQFRALDNHAADFNGGATRTLNTTDMVEGSGCKKVTYNPGVGNVMLYLYAGQQQWQQNTTADGTNLYPIQEKNYVTFDLYVSDAAALRTATGDCGLNLDTDVYEGNQPNAWGNSADAKAPVFRAALANLHDGWNHICVPITFKTDRPDVTGETCHLQGMRIYWISANVPENFYMLMDDVRLMDEVAVETILPYRSSVKDITVAIRELSDEPTFEEKLAIVSAYEALPDDYRNLVVGYEGIATLIDADFEAQVDAMVSQVQEKIDALPDPATAADFETVRAARDAYNLLPAAQKAQIQNPDRLTTAEQQVADSQADIAAATPVINRINALPAVITLGNKAPVAAVRAAYDALSESQKALVTNLARLEDAEAQIAALENPQDPGEDPGDEPVTPTDEPVTPTDEPVTPTDTDTPSDPEEPTEPDYTPGDVDGDGKVTASDALAVLKHAVSKITLTDNSFLAADVDGDRKVDATDALSVLKYAVGKIDHFPVEDLR